MIDSALLSFSPATFASFNVCPKLYAVAQKGVSTLHSHLTTKTTTTRTFWSENTSSCLQYFVSICTTRPVQHASFQLSAQSNVPQILTQIFLLLEKNVNFIPSCCLDSHTTDSLQHLFIPVSSLLLPTAVCAAPYIPNGQFPSTTNL